MNGRHLGLTLLEVMIATMMLGAGMVAVASLFPVAGSIQRKTYDDVVVRQVCDSVDDLMKARPINFLDTISASAPLSALSFDVRVVPANVLNGGSTALALTKYGLVDRCYPSAMDGDPTATNRSYYWVPLIRRVSLTDFQTYIFILKKEQGVDYGSHAETAKTGKPAEVANATDPTTIPIVRSMTCVSLGGGTWDNEQGIISTVTGTGAGGGGLTSNVLLLKDDAVIVKDASAYFEIGDLVLDSKGVTHTVVDVGKKTITLDGYVDPLVKALWYARRSPGGDSPTRKILSFVNGAIVQ